MQINRKQDAAGAPFGVGVGDNDEDLASLDGRLQEEERAGGEGLRQQLLSSWLHVAIRL